MRLRCPRRNRHAGEAAILDLTTIHHLLIALGIGLIIGAERERRKTARSTPSAAGLRTFTIGALLGAVAMLLGGAVMLGLAAGAVAALAVASYWLIHDVKDPGITTEVSLVGTVLLGGLAMVQPALASSIGVVIAIILAARTPLHRFVGEVITQSEPSDVLILGGATLVILPLLPDRNIGPWQALNPHSIWLVVILILGINAVGHGATRWLGARLGVPLLGLVSGFVSSSATIAAMGSWVRGTPACLKAGVAAALLSSVATFVQLGAVIEMTDHRTFLATMVPLGAAGAMGLVTGGFYTLRAWRQPSAEAPRMSQSFSVLLALGFAGVLSAMLIAVAALRVWFGELGLLSAAAVAGVMDVHAAAIAIAAQVADGRISANQAVVPTLVACTTSTAAKILFATTAGTRPFGMRVIPGLVLIVGAAWAGGWFVSALG